jgi:hypothetical protein
MAGAPWRGAYLASPLPARRRRLDEDARDEKRAAKARDLARPKRNLDFGERRPQGERRSDSKRAAEPRVKRRGAKEDRTGKS